MTNPIAALKTILDTTPAPEPRPGDYVALLNENEPNGGVGLFRASGLLVVSMSRAAYEAIVAKGGAA